MRKNQLRRTFQNHTVRHIRDDGTVPKPKISWQNALKQ